MGFEPEPWATVAQVAEHLGVTPVTVYRLMRDEPPLPSHKLGRSRRFKLSEVDGWAMSRCTSPTPDQTAAS